MPPNLIGNSFPLYKLLWVLFFDVEMHRGTKIHDSKKGEKETKRWLRWSQPIHAVPSEPRYRPRPCMSLHWPSSKGATEWTRYSEFFVGTVLKVEIGPKATALGRRSTFVVKRFKLGGGDMTVATINIRSVKLHTTEPPHYSTVCDVGDNYYWIHNRHRSILCSSFLGARNIPFELWSICSGGCTANGRNAWPAALFIDRGWWVGGGERFSPCDGFMYCGDASTSSTSSITFTSSNSSSSYTSSSIASHTDSV